MNVILAEDDLDIQLVARLALKRAGYVTKPFDALTLGQHIKEIVSGSVRL